MRLMRDDSGATALEYVILVAILAVSLIVGINGIAIKVTNVWGVVDADVTATG